MTHPEQPTPTRPNLWISGDRIECMRCRRWVRVNLHPRYLQDAFETFADEHARCVAPAATTRQDVAAPYEGGDE